MDTDSEKTKLEDRLAFIQSYLEHPISQEALRDNQEEQDGAVNLICNVPVNSVESFFAHFQAVGYLAGLRRGRALMTDTIEEVKNEIKNLTE